MKLGSTTFGLACLGLFVLGTGVVRAQPAGVIAAWGGNNCGQCSVPAPNDAFLAVAAGNCFSVGLKSDGGIVVWGSNDQGEYNVPAPNAGFESVAAGYDHVLGLRSDGTIAAWGGNGWGQCNVPAPNAGFVAVAASYCHSLGIKSDGTIVAWGMNDHGQSTVPAPNADFVAVAAGWYHSMGVKSNGTIVVWGWNSDGQRDVPPPNADFVAAAAGEFHCLGLKSNGTIVAWGDNYHGQCNVPAPNAGFVAVAAGNAHSLGLKSDGTIRAWGRNVYGQCNVPAPNRYFVGLSGGTYHTLGLRRSAPIIEAIGDVPHDQGRQVRITWTGGGHEVAGYPPIITEYAIYRKIAALSPRRVGLLAWPPGEWDFVARVPARAEPDYSVLVPTLADSTVSGGMAYSTFFVRARSGDPAFFYDSEPDSGYSVDDLAPAPPTGLRFAGPNLLVWRESEEPDFDYFTVYGSSNPVPDSTKVRLISTSGTQADVVGGSYAYYHLTATDFAGNEGSGASINDPQVTPAGPGGAIPARFALLPSRPNPTRGAVSIRFDLPKAAEVEIKIHDASGRVLAVLAKRPYPAGRHELGWAGTDAAGTHLASGAYFLRIQAGTDAAAQRILVAR